MIRMMAAAALIGAIYLSSPVRDPGHVSAEVAALASAAKTSLVGAAASSGIASNLAEAAFRRTLTEAGASIVSTPPSGRPSPSIDRKP